MLLRFPCGQGLRLFENATSGKKPTPTRGAALRAAVETLESRELLSANWFVAPSGSDTNSGSLSSPFKTIQRAANLAQPGDHVEIRAGVYHEAVTPAHSGNPSAPITFEAYNGEHVTVSGADPVGGWAKYSGNIYQASMPGDMGAGNNQIFVDGRALTQARWPNTTVGDPSHPTNATMQSVRGNTIYNSSLNQPANYWKGAIIHMAPGQGWDDQTGTVISSAPGSITISYVWHSGYAVPKAGNPFYLFGKFQSLDAPGEWYRDPSGKLYVMTPGSDNPAGHDVEAKRRLYAFNLNNIHDVTIHGVNLFAATIITNAASTDTVINGITAQYVSEQTIAPTAWWLPPYFGIIVKGAHSVVENSTIAFSSGDGIVVSGTGSLIKNNVVHDTNYVGYNVGAIRVLTAGVTVDHNTVYNSGRHGIVSEVPHTTITYNTIHDVGLVTTEAGGIYTQGINGQGSVIAYNQIYNMHSGGFGQTALFLDNNSSGWNVHHNITWNVDYGLKMNFVCNYNNIYNNTLGATLLSINTNQLGNWNGTSIYNNLLLNRAVFTGGARVTNNYYSSSSSGSAGAGDFASGASGTPVVITPPPTPTPTPTPIPTPVPTTPSAKTKIDAVNYTGHSNVAADGSGGVGYAYNNSWVSYKLDFGTGVSKLTAALAAIHANGKLEVHLGSPTGSLLGTINVAVTGAWNKYTSQSAAVTGLKGVQTVYLVFKGALPGVANLSWLQFA
ncbi:MAG: carbohydrate-binding cenc domain protein [Phycisphaerales bacterium]|nr:carbohydrate-binding cenc domain protein [Phycisphaerales bacterium]